MSTGVGDVVDGRRRDYVTQIAQYRQDFRRYLRELDWADEWRSAAFCSAEDGMAHDARVLARLHEDGLNRYGWPESAGGLGGNEIHRAIYYEELAYAMLPVPAQHWTLETLWPALLRFAPALAAQYLPGYLNGSEWWGQCSQSRIREATWRPCTPAPSPVATGTSPSTARRSGPVRARPQRGCWC